MNPATNTTHLLWADRWIEVRRGEVMGEPGWEFKCGADAADWLAYPDIDWREDHDLRLG